MDLSATFASIQPFPSPTNPQFWYINPEQLKFVEHACLALCDIMYLMLCGCIDQPWHSDTSRKSGSAGIGYPGMLPGDMYTKHHTVTHLRMPSKIYHFRALWCCIHGKCGPRKLRSFLSDQPPVRHHSQSHLVANTILTLITPSAIFYATS